MLGKNCHKFAIPGAVGHVLLKSNTRENIGINPQWMDKQDSSIFIVNKKDKVQKRKIVLGKSIKGRSEVLQGLKPGDRIIVSSSRKPRRGLQAIIKKEVE